MGKTLNKSSIFNFESTGLQLSLQFVHVGGHPGIHGLKILGSRNLQPSIHRIKTNQTFKETNNLGIVHDHRQIMILSNATTIVERFVIDWRLTGRALVVDWSLTAGCSVVVWWLSVESMSTGGRFIVDWWLSGWDMVVERYTWDPKELWTIKTLPTIARHCWAIRDWLIVDWSSPGEWLVVDCWLIGRCLVVGHASELENNLSIFVR